MLLIATVRFDMHSLLVVLYIAVQFTSTKIVEIKLALDTNNLSIKKIAKNGSGLIKSNESNPPSSASLRQEEKEYIYIYYLYIYIYVYM